MSEGNSRTKKSGGGELPFKYGIMKVFFVRKLKIEML